MLAKAPSTNNCEYTTDDVPVHKNEAETSAEPNRYNTKIRFSPKRSANSPAKKAPMPYGSRSAVPNNPDSLIDSEKSSEMTCSTLAIDCSSKCTIAWAPETSRMIFTIRDERVTQEGTLQQSDSREMLEHLTTNGHK